ncbi:MAG: alpha-hydroxy acid oxidase [Planctomycetota bacterium]|nr:alpha-hydroxy acid oxidase [Planctomycetota bacterium]
MNAGPDDIESRRMFLRFLAGSPLLACAGLSACSTGGPRLEPTEGEDPPSPPDDKGPPDDEGVRGADGSGESGDDQGISRPEEAINVFDFEAVARKKLPPAHYGYLATGVDDDGTVRANREGFSKIQIRMRRLIDVSRIDTTTEIFGVTWETPIVLAPAGSQRAFHRRGEIATARAARTRKHLQILSTVTTTSVEDVIAARGEPVWFQLYPTPEWETTQALVTRAEAAGCPVVVLTVDLLGGSNRETLERFKRTDKRKCARCHEGFFERKPMFDGLDVKSLSPRWLTWDFVRRLKEHTTMKVVIKGIVTREDAGRCLEYGVDGIVVSNHGGRAEESGRATIDCLPEVMEAVGEKIPVLIDGGFRRGTDIFKALALGARAICIGRPYLWGRAAFGQAGVESVLDLLRAELEMVMRQTGATSTAEIRRDLVLSG